MELAPRYCRSCGSRILVKNVCHNCNNDPLKGDNYCYDCGALTPDADNCLNCGAKYKKTFPVNPILLASILIIVVAAAVYFVSRSDKQTSASQQTNTTSPIPSPEPGKQELPASPGNTVVNNTVDTSAPVTAKATDTSSSKPVLPDSAKTNSAGIFSPEEARAYGARCTYFIKNHRNQVLFFISGGSAYIKMNDKIHELKRKQKGVDMAVYGGNEYEASIRIDGLSGSAKEWLASCTLNIKDLTQNSSAKHKVYSSCIEL